jgi:hypothetical protein
LPIVGGSLPVLRLPPPLKLAPCDIAEILLKVALKHQKSINHKYTFQRILKWQNSVVKPKNRNI